MIVVKNEAERICGGVVYRGDGMPDSQGDCCDDPRVLWDAMKKFMARGPRLKVMHGGRTARLSVIESFLTEDTPVKKGAEMIPAHSWYMAVYVPESEEGIWQAVVNKELVGFSLAGKASVEEVE